jgi:hypothetical protein
MNLDERLTFFLLGCGVGLVFGYIVARLREIKDKEDTIEAKVDHLVRKKDEEGAIRFLSVTGLGLLLVVLLTAYAAFVSGHTANEVEDKVQSDKVALCQSGTESRNVQRGLVEAIYNLATGSLERPKGAKPLTKIEVEQYNAYIDRVNKFRSDMYAQIKPSKACAPYVEDDHVEPPTPPFPHISK